MRSDPREPKAESQRPMNVLLISLDDMKPIMGCYGHPEIHTPNIDKLAERGTIFTHAYCQMAVCCPSRASLLTGKRPDTTRVWDLVEHFRNTIPQTVTLPQQFKNHGYFSQGLGKIFHRGKDDALSWSVPHWDPERGSYDQRRQYPAAWPSELSDDQQFDGKTLLRTLDALRKIKDRPFFLAFGTWKPHLPFHVPIKYFDLYPTDSIPLPSNAHPPKDVPALALTNWEELRGHVDMPNHGPVTPEQARQLIRGYYASVSFVDALVGRLLDELDRLGLHDNTIVVLFGDHGFHLGDHGLWTKKTNFEEATRSPLIICAPGQKHPGAKCDALVEFVDIYPTICELAGLPVPDDLEGISLVPLMRNPDRPWKSAAFSQYHRPGDGRGYTSDQKYYPKVDVMGYSMRTRRWRYNEWIKGGKEKVAVELYDYKNDPGETVNLAHQPEYQETIERLSAKLHAGRRGALPPAD
ncbi:MAG: sulfatase [Pirellulales bacterium]|nr:sulfatase [Pirellulales bacterium]